MKFQNDRYQPQDSSPRTQGQDEIYFAPVSEKSEDANEKDAPVSQLPQEILNNAPSPGSASLPPEEKKNGRRSLFELLLAWISLPLCWFLMEMRGFSKHPLGVFLALTAISILSTLYLCRVCPRSSPKRLLTEGIFLVLSISLLTNGNATVRGFVILAWILSLPYRAAALSGLSSGTPFASTFCSDALSAYRRLPFRGLKDFFASLFGLGTTGAKKIGKTALFLIIGLGIALVPTLIVILLLSYDSLFTDLLSKTFDLDLDLSSLGSFLLAIPCAAFLFGLLFTAARHANGTNKKEAALPRFPSLPCVLLCAAVTPILAVYVLFFVSQMPYYLSAFTGILPDGLTYAVYAKEGFFQLCAVSVINALLLLAFSLLLRAEHPAAALAKKIYSSLISVFTLILISTAISKMILYIASYGLTQKRVYSSWLMLLLGFVFLAVLLRQWVRKLPLSCILVCIILIFSAAIALPNVDGMIASYNVNAYLDGTLPEVDVEMLEEDLGTSAVPSLVRLRDHLNGMDSLSPEQAALLSQTEETLTRMQKTLEDRPAFSFTFPDARARRALGE